MPSTLFVPSRPTFDHVPSFHSSKTDAPEQPEYTLGNLVDELKQYLGQGGIDDEHIDHGVLIDIVSKYSPDSTDWFQYMKNDPSKGYTRNLVANISGRANLLLLVWNPTRGSPIHDHANAHCIMNVLAGELKETMYHVPSDDTRMPLSVKKTTVYRPGEVAYISDQIGLHQVVNPSDNQLAVSLHLYTPPNAVDFGYHLYDRDTGKKVHVYQA